MKHQKGSVHIGISIVLIVVVLGLIGFIFWQNFVRNKDDGTNTAVSGSQNVGIASTLTQTKSITQSGATFSFNYPQSWTIKETDANEGTVSSADGSVYYDYSLTPMGAFGQTCDQDATVKISYFGWDKSSLSSSVIVTEYINESVEGTASTYGYGFGLADDTKDTIKNSIVGQPGCNMAGVGFPITADVTAVDGTPIYVVFRGSLEGIDQNGASKEQISAAFESEAGLIAREIAKSATLKK